MSALDGPTPICRWSLIGVLVLLSLWLEIRPEPTVSHPYLVRDLARGEPVADALEWRYIARGVLEAVAGVGFADRPLTTG